MMAGLHGLQGDDAKVPIPRDDEDDDIANGVLRPTGAELETVDLAVRVYRATDVPQSMQPGRGSGRVTQTGRGSGRVVPLRLLTPCPLHPARCPFTQPPFNALQLRPRLPTLFTRYGAQRT